MWAPSSPARSAQAADIAWIRLYRAGAIASAVAVVLYVAALVLVVVSDAPPTSGAAAMLAYIDTHRTVYIVKQLLWLLPSLAMMIVVLALAIAVRHVDRSWAAIAGMIAVFSWALSLAWPTTGEGSLAMVLLSDRYADAATDAARAPFLGAAETLIALNDMPAIIGVLQTLGILLLALLMLRSVFSRMGAWLGVATGALGIICEVLRPVLGWAYAVYGLLLFVWLIWVAWALWRLAGEREGETVDVVA